MPVEPRSQGFASGPVLFNPRKKWNDLNPRERGMSSAGEFLAGWVYRGMCHCLYLAFTLVRTRS